MLTKCRELYDSLHLCFKDCSEHDKNLPVVQARTLKDIEGILCTCALLIRRALATLSSSQRINIEKGTQAFARYQLTLQDVVFSAHERKIAQEVIASAKSWLQVDNGTLMEQNELAFRRFRAWTEASVPRVK